MTVRTLREVHRRRFAAQRLTGAGLRHGADVVRLLGCVQAQDAPLAAWSLGMRLRPGTTYAAVLAEQAAGGWLRTHALRPTWHLVAPEDLRWMQALTGPRVEASMGARHRTLGLDEPTAVGASAVLERVLAGPTPLVRKEVAAAFRDAGLPSGGEHVAHLLLVAELRALVCSGPPRGTEHTYVLVDEVVPPDPNGSLTGDDARCELTRRFVAGHGPASERDLNRWSTLTLGQVRAALDDLGDALERVEVEGHTLWFDAGVPARTVRRHRAHLLPTFDEVSLTYATTSFPRRDPASARSRLVSEHGGGIVVVDGDDVGTWKRVVSPGGLRVVVTPDVALAPDETDAVAGQAERLAAFLERPLDLVIAPAPPSR